MYAGDVEDEGGFEDESPEAFYSGYEYEEHDDASEEQTLAVEVQLAFATQPSENTDEQLAFIAQVDSEMADGFVTMREAHKRMNDIKMERRLLRRSHSRADLESADRGRAEHRAD